MHSVAALTARPARRFAELPSTRANYLEVLRLDMPRFRYPQDL